MLASCPASMVNQKSPDLGIPNRFSLSSSRFNVRNQRGADIRRLIPAISSDASMHFNCLLADEEAVPVVAAAGQSLLGRSAGERTLRPFGPVGEHVVRGAA